MTPGLNGSIANDLQLPVTMLTIPDMDQDAAKIYKNSCQVRFFPGLFIIHQFPFAR
jgi:hypothetical protein